jgi:hypothetical protein
MGQSFTALISAMPPRGRPLKFGRPSRTVTLTLPDDAVEWLQSLHEDPAWAIVGLFERARRPARTSLHAVAELVQLPGRRGLILVRPELLRHVRGAAVVPLSDGRAFIALSGAGGAADLEVAILDRLESADVTAAERSQLTEFRTQLRAWRHEGLKFHPRSILVAERRPAAEPARPLSSLATAGTRR